MKITWRIDQNRRIEILADDVVIGWARSEGPWHVERGRKYEASVATTESSPAMHRVPAWLGGFDDLKQAVDAVVWFHEHQVGSPRAAD